MQIQDLTPTPLLQAAERQAVAIRPATLPRARYLYIAFNLLRLLLGHAFLWFARQHTPRRRAQLFNAFAERLGFLWVKLGQVMAMRCDLFSDEFCNEVQRLRHVELGVPFEVIRQAVEAELGKPLAELFAEFDERPFRAGLTFQVHRAIRQGDDGWVAVKVQRVGIEPIYRQDQKALGWLIVLFRWLNVFAHVSWDNLAWELDQLVTADIDYRYEAANLRRMRRILGKRSIYVPRVYQSLCTQRMLVMEFVRGALMADVVALTRTDQPRLQTWLAENNIDLRRLGRRLFTSFLRQLMEDNQVHGNLRPSNILMLKNSRFALVDLSVLMTVESEFLRRYVQSIRALSTYQYGRAADLTLLLSPELPVIDVQTLKEGMVRCFRAWDARSELKRMPYQEKSLSSLYRELGKILFANHVVPTLTFMKLCHAWGTLDESLSLMIPDANYSRLFRKYFQGASQRAFLSALDKKSLAQALFNFKDSLTEYQQLLGTMLRRGALVFQGGTTKLSDAMASLLRVLRVATLGGIVFFTLKLLDLHFATVLDGTPIEQHLDNIPVENTDLLAVVVLFGGYLFWTLSRLEKRFRQKDVRLPSTSSPSYSR